MVDLTDFDERKHSFGEYFLIVTNSFLVSSLKLYVGISHTLREFKSLCFTNIFFSYHWNFDRRDHDVYIKAYWFLCVVIINCIL
jgi:hypothetical protein